MIKENEGIIVLPRGITKSRKEEIINITSPLAVVLDSVSMHTKASMHHSNLVVGYFLVLELTN